MSNNSDNNHNDEYEDSDFWEDFHNFVQILREMVELWTRTLTLVNEIFPLQNIDFPFIIRYAAELLINFIQSSSTNSFSSHPTFQPNRDKTKNSTKSSDHSEPNNSNKAVSMTAKTSSQKSGKRKATEMKSLNPSSKRRALSGLENNTSNTKNTAISSSKKSGKRKSINDTESTNSNVTSESTLSNTTFTRRPAKDFNKMVEKVMIVHPEGLTERETFHILQQSYNINFPTHIRYISHVLADNSKYRTVRRKGEIVFILRKRK